MKYTGKRDRRKSARKSSVSAAGLHALLQNGPKLPRDYPWLVLGAVLEDLASVLPSPDIDRVRAIVRSRDNARIGELEKDWGLQSINSCSDRPPIWVTRARRLLANVIRKYADDSIESRSGRVEVAMKKFMAAEVKCTDVNQNISSSLYYSDGTPTQALFSLRNEIALVLGSLADADVTYWSRHGPGSDTKTQCGRNSKYVKYSEWPYPVTGAARSYARKLIESDERWFGALEDSYRRDLDIEMWQVIDWDWFWELVFCEEDGNRITTVPKDWSEDRPIAIEPRMNMMLQLGVDGYIRSRIKRCWGLNLNSQELNQDLSKLGSILTDADTPVTIDLSSASDSVSLKLVELLLPPEWYEYLVALRSP